MGIPFYMFGQVMNSIIRADGNHKRNRLDLRTRIEPASFAGVTYISRSSGIAPPATAHRYRLATLQ